MGRLSAEGTDAVLLGKLKILLRRALDNPSHGCSNNEYRRKTSAASSYDTFVQTLDVEDPVAIKCVELLAKDVLSQARRRKNTLRAAARTDQSSSSAAPAGRAWNAASWTGSADRTRQEETAEYDAIIADAQRRVASPLPGYDSTRWRTDFETPTSYLNSNEWPNLNSGAGYEYGNSSRHRNYDISHHWNDGYSSPDESEGGGIGQGSEELDAHRRTLEAERTIARARRQRDEEERGSNDAGITTRNDSTSSNTSATRFRIIERLEQRRRIREETAQQLREIRDRYGLPHSLPSEPSLRDDIINAATSATNQHNHNDAMSSSSSLPIIVGGDFSELPDSVTTSSSNTVRATYGPARDLHRVNSIRRSGFHSAPSGSAPTSNSTSALPMSLPRTSANPLATSDNDPSSSSSSPSRVQRLIPRSPLTVPDIHLPPPASFNNPTSSLTPQTDSARTTLRRLSALAESNSHNSDRQTDPLAVVRDSSASLEQRIDSFQDFARQSRFASRLGRDELPPSRRLRDTPPSHSDSTDTASSSVDDTRASLGWRWLDDSSASGSGATADEVSEMLGSSSTVAALAPAILPQPRNIYPMPRRRATEYTIPTTASEPMPEIALQEAMIESVNGALLQHQVDRQAGSEGSGDPQPQQGQAVEEPLVQGMQPPEAVMTGGEASRRRAGEQTMSLEEFLHGWP